MDVTFAERILDFVKETRANPRYRDTPLGGGVYRHMDEKSIDLSSHFLDAEFTFRKIGESDHGYAMLVSSLSGLWISVQLHDQELDDFLHGLKEIIEDHSVETDDSDQAG